jgi:site-specific DNA-cytosine methylase
MKVVDLFSGLGGFSEAFLQHGHHVTRYDIDYHFLNVPKTTIIDVMELEPEDIEADVVLASPPCECFSIAAVSHNWPNHVPTLKTMMAIEAVDYALWLIQKSDPIYWILENPVGMLRNEIGKPARTVYLCAWGKEAKKPTDLWGKLPPIDWKQPMKWQKAPRGSKTGVQGYKDSAEAARIPYDFSLAVCLACEGNSPQMILEGIE